MLESERVSLFFNLVPSAIDIYWNILLILLANGRFLFSDGARGLTEILLQSWTLNVEQTSG